jgi:PAS domain-containing protein
MTEKTNKAKLSLTIDAELAAEAQRIADARYGGNISMAFNEAIRTQIELSRGPMSKIFQFNAEIAGVIRSFDLKTVTSEHCVDWIIPALGLGIEAKMKFTPGKGESATIATMAYSAGQKLCSEIWIVVPDSISQSDKSQWDRVSQEFHLCPVRVVPASTLSTLLAERMAELRIKAAKGELGRGRVETDMERRVTDVNDVFVELCGHPRSELMGKRLNEILQGPFTEPSSVATLREALLARRAVTVDITNHKANGDPYRVRLNIRPTETGFVGETELLAS